jgi:hypothetical protein
MSLLTYQQARPWARAIRTYVAAGIMPPWHADPAHGKWLNDRRLTSSEKDTIDRWVTAGAPEGDLKDLPRPPEYTPGWNIGRPDAVVAMEQEYSIPARGEIPYQYFEVQTNFTEDKWVQALEIRAGNRAVVHHVLVYAWFPDDARPAPVFRAHNPLDPRLPAEPTGADETEESTQTVSVFDRLLDRLREAFRPPSRRDMLIAQVAPGRTPIVYPAGTALLLRAGTGLTFQIHYTPNGTPTTDKTSIGFKFARQPPVHVLRVRGMQNTRFVIPAGAANHPVESRLEFLEDVTIYSIAPHTHLRGKSWEYTMTYPGGRSDVILGVPKFDFNWQTDYVFATPLRVPKGSMLKSVAHYDNSRSNKANPDPTRPVYQGAQTWEEMQYTGLLYSVDKDARTAVKQR